MAKYLTQIEQKNFVNGWVESSALNAAENTVSETMNIQYKRDGSAHKRPAFTEDSINHYRHGGNQSYDNDNNLLSLEFMTETAGQICNFYIWKQAGGVVDILVSTNGDIITYSEYLGGEPSSENAIAHKLSRVFTNITASNDLQMTAHGEDLIIVDGSKFITRVSVVESFQLDPTQAWFGNFNVEYEQMKPKVRDYWGMTKIFPDDMLGVTDVQYKAVPESRGHHYNMFNQGWYAKPIVSTAGGSLTIAQDILETEGFGLYPEVIGNLDIWSHGLVKVNDQSTWSASKYIANENYGTNKAPLGHFIIDLFSRGPSRLMKIYQGDHYLKSVNTDWRWVSNYGTGYIFQLIDVPALEPDTLLLDPATYNAAMVFKYDSNDEGFSCLEAHAGRMFFSGAGKTILPEATSPDLGSLVAYSRLGATSQEVANLYADNDPTSAESQLLSTDGGFVLISGMNKCHELISLGSDIVVFGDNGVWCITSKGAGFSSEDQSVYKISNVGVESGRAVVRAESEIYYFTSAGVHSVSMDKQTGRLATQNISEDRIPSYMASIINPSMVKGAYDKIQRKVKWLTTSDANGFGFYDQMLELDVLTRAYELHSWDVDHQPTPYSESISDADSELRHWVKGFVVSEECLALPNETVPSIDAGVLKYMVGSRARGALQGYHAYLMQMTGDTGYDFFVTPADTGPATSQMVAAKTPYIAYLETADNQAGDIARKKDGARFTFHFEQSETSVVDVTPWPVVGASTGVELENASSCMVRAKWDFMEESGGGLWSTEFEAYKFRNPITLGTVGDFSYPQKVISTKTKIRGKGISVKLRMECGAGKTMRLLGWSSPLAITKKI